MYSFLWFQSDYYETEANALKTCLFIIIYLSGFILKVFLLSMLTVGAAAEESSWGKWGQYRLMIVLVVRRSTYDVSQGSVIEC